MPSLLEIVLDNRGVPPASYSRGVSAMMAVPIDLDGVPEGTVVLSRASVLSALSRRLFDQQPVLLGKVAIPDAPDKSKRYSIHTWHDLVRVVEVAAKHVPESVALRLSRVVARAIAREIDRETIRLSGKLRLCV